MNGPRNGPTLNSSPWASKLLAVTAGLLLFFILSGLIIYLAPLPSDFMESQGLVWVTVQWLILLHTIFGLVSVAVFGWYQWKHYFKVRPAAVDWGKLVGYFSFWVFVVCGVSGLIIAWQAWFGTRITYWLDTVHTWSGFVLVPLLGWHLVRTWRRVRRRAGLELVPFLRGVQWRLVW